MKFYDWLVVGAGLTGAVLAERIARGLDQTVLLIDRRDHIAGNAHDAVNEDGILIHRYGPHIFHTNDQSIVDYLSRFTAWRPYEHRVLGMVNGTSVPVPFNDTSTERLLGADFLRSIKPRLEASFGAGARVAIQKLQDSEDPAIRDLAGFIFREIFLGYTLKQWGMTPDQLSPSVMARVPVQIGRDDRYFADRFQMMPADGYTAMVARMLDHPNISLSLCTDFADLRAQPCWRRLIFTGALDALHGYNLGELPYRSLRFEFETVEQAWAQQAGQVNYPSPAVPYTRITEFKHLTGQAAPRTVIAREYPEAHRIGINEPYYPIPRDDNRSLHALYQDLTVQEFGNAITAGRLADYKYYNMDQAVGRALAVFANEVSGSRPARTAQGGERGRTPLLAGLQG